MRTHRDSIWVEDARILDHQSFTGYQHILRVQAPEIAKSSGPGSFVHVRCEPGLTMRRPMSIMRSSPDQGWVDMLYKQVGVGTRALAARVPGESLSIIGPIGVPFQVSEAHRLPLLIAGGVGIPPMIFLADSLRSRLNEIHPLVIMGSEIPFPFELSESTESLPGIPEGVNASLSLVEQWGIPSRLASLQGYAGCFHGYVTDIARVWLEALSEQDLASVAIYSCGPTPMLKSVARLAKELGIPCQVSLEEFMACAVGGCAGCSVRVKTADGEAMKRVCVDGPVFDARQVFF